MTRRRTARTGFSNIAGEVFARFTSRRRPDTTYEVSIVGVNPPVIICTCKVFRYADDGQCQHTRRVWALGLVTAAETALASRRATEAQTREAIEKARIERVDRVADVLVFLNQQAAKTGFNAYQFCPPDQIKVASESRYYNNLLAFAEALVPFLYINGKPVARMDTQTVLTNDRGARMIVFEEHEE